jgi:hypothetical protein
MKAILCLTVLFAPFAAGEDQGDKAAIARAVEMLNRRPLPAGIFARDSDARSELERLPKPIPVEFGVPGTDRPTVTISHEPWGEAAINLGGRPAVMERVNPRIACGAIRFLTPDVAMADGTWAYRGGEGGRQILPLFFVLKKEDGAWKIVSLRVLAAR